MLGNFFTCLLLVIVLSGCGDEGIPINRTLLPAEEPVPAAPSWTPDAITMDELIYPYAAKHAVGIHDIAGEEFRLASCEVLYKARRVRRSERDNRWVRLSTGYSPQHATRWTHNGVPQWLYIFLNFQTEADFQRFGVGDLHENVPFTVVGTSRIRENTWELTLMYQNPMARTATVRTPIDSTPIANGKPVVSFTADAETGYFFEGSVCLNGVTLTGVAYDTGGLTLRAAAGQRIEDEFPTPLRLVLTQRSAPTRARRFGRRIEFTHDDIRYHGRYATLSHVHLSQEQSKDLRLIGEDIAVGDIFHIYVYGQ